jgi:hypothetical protein
MGKPKDENEKTHLRGPKPRYDQKAAGRGRKAFSPVAT